MPLTDRTYETTTTIGTGDVILAGAKTGFQAFFEAYTVGDRNIEYCMENVSAGQWEIGLGTLLTATTFARTKVLRSSNSNTFVNFSAGTKNIFVSPSADKITNLIHASPNARMVFIGDSLTFGGQDGRAPGISDGRTWYTNTSITGSANIGGTAWIPYALVDGRAGVAGGTLSTDGTGRIRWTYTGDTAGPYVDVSQGGWFYLSSGSIPNSGILIAVRGNTPPMTSVSATVSNAGGIPSTADYKLLGYVPWVAGALGDTFADYKAYGIPSATSTDILQFTNQVLSYDTEAVCILAGINDSPATAAAAQTAINNLKTMVDMARLKARFVYFMAITPNPSATSQVNGFLSLISESMKMYCRLLPNVRFVSAFDRLVNPNTNVLGGNSGGRTGVFSDFLHFMPYGAYLCASPLVEAIKRDYTITAVDRSTVGVWDATLQAGCFNINPTLRGSSGTATGPRLTGTVPDGWTLIASGSAQTCTTSFDADTEVGLDWFSMSVASAAAGDYHELYQTVTLPTGVSTGDYFQLVTEMKIFNVTGAGIAVLAVQANSNSNIQADYLLGAGRDIATFPQETSGLHFRSEPQKLLAGTTAFTIRIRVGAKTGGGAGKIGFRKFRIEKCSAPLAG